MGALTSLLERRNSIEDPQTPLAAIFDMVAGRPTAAGPRINESSAETLSAWYCGIRILAEGVAALPLRVYRRLEGGGREIATDHPVDKVLSGRWNPFMTPFVGKETLMRHTVGWGNGYTEIQRTRGGEVAALWPLLPDRTHVKIIGGRKAVVTAVDGVEVPLRAEDVLHVPGPGFDGFSGKSPVTLARESLGLSSAAEQFGASFYGSGANATGVLEHPARLGTEAHEHLRAQFEKQASGLSNAHRTLILEEGMKWTQRSIPPDDAQFLETRKFQVTEVARWLNMAPHKLKDMERATFTNIESENRSHLTETLMSWMVRIEESAEASLLTEKERETLFIEFLTEGFLRGDSAAQGEFFTKMFNIGAMNRDEIRSKINMNPVEDGSGKTYFVPLNMVPVDQAEIVEEDQPDPSIQASIRTERRVAGRVRQRSAHMPIFTDAFQKVLNRELIAGRKALKKSVGDRSIADFGDWVEDFYKDYGEKVSDRLLPVLMSYGRNMLQAVAEEMGEDEPADADEFVRGFAKRLGIRWSSKSRKELRDLVKKYTDDPEALQGAVTKRFDTWHEERAQKAAQNETVRAGEALTVFGYAAAGVVTIRWILSGDGCPLCSQFNGRTVGITQSFASPGHVVNPSDGGSPMTVNTSIGHPPLHRGCDCVIVPG